MSAINGEDQEEYMNTLDVLKFPFPYKLWVIAQLNEFLSWSIDGTTIQLDIPRMQEYLQSSRSIFVIKTSGKFIEQLTDFQFERIRNPGTSSTTLLHYRHEFFQRYRLDLLGNVRRVTFYNMDNAQTAESEVSQSGVENKFPHHMKGDLCTMVQDYLTKIQKKRLERDLTNGYAFEIAVLNEKLKRADMLSNSGVTNKRARGVCVERKQSVMLPNEIYTNVVQSVLSEGGFQGAYGGYYGNNSYEDIDNFFNDYLPRYEHGVLKVPNIREIAKTGSTTEKPEEDDPNIGEIPKALKTDTLPIPAEPLYLQRSTLAAEAECVAEAQTHVTNSQNEFITSSEPIDLNISTIFNYNNSTIEFNVTKCSDANTGSHGNRFQYDSNDSELSPETKTAQLVAQAEEPLTIESCDQQVESKYFYDELCTTFELLQSPHM